MDRADFAVCPLCPRACRLREGEAGFCRVRSARGGKVLARHPGKIDAMQLDPIEKKPLAYFHPGAMIFSLGGFGCNLRCPFCQNDAYLLDEGGWEAEGRCFTVKELVDEATRLKARGNIGIAFTYNEPLLDCEWIYQVFTRVKSERLETVLVTNGCFNPPVIEKMLRVTSAWNIDLKAFTQEGYARLSGDLETVKASIRHVAGRAHLEVTTLIVPGLNNTDVEIEAAARWLASVDVEIPWHLTRCFPHGAMTAPATDLGELRRLAAVAGRYMHRVRLGNVAAGI